MYLKFFCNSYSIFAIHDDWPIWGHVNLRQKTTQEDNHTIVSFLQSYILQFSLRLLYCKSNASTQWLQKSCTFVFLLFKKFNELLQMIKCEYWHATTCFKHKNMDVHTWHVSLKLPNYFKVSTKVQQKKLHEHVKLMW